MNRIILYYLENENILEALEKTVSEVLGGQCSLVQLGSLDEVQNYTKSSIILLVVDGTKKNLINDSTVAFFENYKQSRLKNVPIAACITPEASNSASLLINIGFTDYLFWSIDREDIFVEELGNLIKSKEDLSASFGKVSISVIDDNPVETDLLKQVLNIYGCKDVSVHYSVEEFKTAPTHADIYLIDLVFYQGVSGFSLLSYIQKIAPKSTIIMISSTNNNEAAKQAILRGADDFWFKPLNFSVLIPKLQRIAANITRED
ncbi:response regulator [Limibacter armeniacum]|uniref:response regulator n=1 Tax=Limibacter armeniacum TaxID=466084 RepID=UPI002FE58EC4